MNEATPLWMAVAGVLFSTAVLAQASVPKPIGCLIQPDQVTELGSPVVGIVAQMLVERGDVVRKGQAVAILRNDIDRASLRAASSRALAQAEVRAAQANLAFVKQRLERDQKLREQGFISHQALEQTLAETEVAQQKLALTVEQQRVSGRDMDVAMARLEERTIRSPFDGMVAERYLTVGERVELQPIVRVAKVNPLRVEVVMPGALFGTIETGSTVDITPDLPGAKARPARITLVDQILDPASGTFRVRLELPNPDSKIPAGLRCKSDFSKSTPAAVQPLPYGPSTVEPTKLKMELELSPKRLNKTM